MRVQNGEITNEQSFSIENFMIAHVTVGEKDKCLYKLGEKRLRRQNGIVEDQLQGMASMFQTISSSNTIFTSR